MNQYFNVLQQVFFPFMSLVPTLKSEAKGGLLIYQKILPLNAYAAYMTHNSYNQRSWFTMGLLSCFENYTICLNLIYPFPG